MAFRKDRNLASTLMEKILENPYARSFVIEWFVDEDFLDGYYGDMILKLRQKRVDKSLKLFIYIMLYKRAMMTNDILEAEKYYNKICIIKVEEDIHEILMGRYLSVKFLNVEKRNDYHELLGVVSSFIRKRDLRHVIAFVFYLCKELIINEKKKAFHDVMRIAEKYFSYQKMPDYFHWEKRVLNGLELLKCFYLLDCKKEKEAMVQYLRVDPRKFEIFHIFQMQRLDSRIYEAIMKK
jgi:hypothetical protein